MSGSESGGPGGGRAGGEDQVEPQSRRGKKKQARSSQASHRPNTIVSRAPRGARGQAQKDHQGPDEVVSCQISDGARPWAGEHLDGGKVRHPIHGECAQDCRKVHGAA